MRVTLTFDLPEEKTELFDALRGIEWELVAWDLDQWLRSEIKYQDKNELQSARDKLWELINDYGLEFST